MSQEGGTPPEEAATDEQEAPAEAATTTARTTRRNNNNRYQPNIIQSVEPHDWEGMKPALKVVLGLRLEKLTHKVSYDVFAEKLATYVITDIDSGDKIACAITHHVDPRASIVEPIDLSLADQNSFVKVELKKREISKYIRDQENVDTAMSKLYKLIWGQTTSALQATIKSEADYELKSNAYDPIWLMKSLKTLIAGIDKKGNKQSNLFDALYLFMTMKQGKEESCDSFQRRQVTSFQTLELAGGRNILSNTKIIEAVDLDNPTKEEIAAEEQKFLAMHTVKRSDPVRFGKLLESLQDGTNKGRDEYPKTNSEALDLLLRDSGATNTISRSGRGNHRGGRGRGNGNFTFTQVAGRGKRNEQSSNSTTAIPGDDGRLHADVQCYGCNSFGHYRGNCPTEQGKTGTGLL